MKAIPLQTRWWISRLLYASFSATSAPRTHWPNPSFAFAVYASPLQVEDESRSALLPQKAGTTPEQTSALEDTIFTVSSQLSTVRRMQKYFRTRENRNFSTVRSTESRIFNFRLVEVGMMVGMAALQVWVVRFFFQGARKGYV
jgi:emp24/gp25L/p24 family/GOLD